MLRRSENKSGNLTEQNVLLRETAGQLEPDPWSQLRGQGDDGDSEHTSEPGGPLPPLSCAQLPTRPSLGWAGLGQLAPFPCHLPSATSDTAIISF